MNKNKNNDDDDDDDDDAADVINNDDNIINNDDNSDKNIMALSGLPYFEISLHICIHNIYTCKTHINVAINHNKFFYVTKFVVVDGNMYVNLNMIYQNGMN